MTVFGSTCTRLLINRTLICNAILYHFQITLICGRINRPSSHSHFFSSRAHLSNSSLFVSATCQQKYVSSTSPSNVVIRTTTDYAPTQLQSRYRRHLFTLNLSLQITRARRSLNQLSRLPIHSVQEFHISRFNLGRMCLKQISSLFTIKSHTSLSPLRLFCARVVTFDMTLRETKTALLLLLLLILY